MSPPPSLAAITLLARSGALDLAWDRLAAGGFAADDPGALTVRGRLLKDRARLATGPERRKLYHAAAEAYARAGAIDNATYPLINAATLALLSGHRAMARALAERTLARLDSGETDLETPYYRIATRAEALLLLRRLPEARAALAAAIAEAPLAFEDHASTLRQFALIHAELREDAGWLEAYRPPRTLHFAGRMGAPDDPAATAAMRADIDALITAERIGAGYGALAAGADIIIAEALIAAGAALHIVLPAPVDAFLAQSVVPYGADWPARFAALIDAAASLTMCGDGVGSPDDEAIGFADEMAMGRAILAAGEIATDAVQLLVTGADGDGGDSTARSGLVWRGNGRRQHILSWRAAATRLAPAPSAVAAACAAAALALLQIELFDARTSSLPGGMAAALAGIAAIVAGGAAPVAAQTNPNGVRLAYADPVTAATVALAVRARIDPALGVRIGGHYAVTAMVADPFAARPLPFGPEPARTGRIAGLTAGSAIYVSEDFVAGLLARSGDGFRCEYVGDAPGEARGADLRLFALKPVVAAA